MNVKTKLSSEWIYKFYKELEENKVENHALIIMQNGETVFEEYSYPYSADMPHTMFSVTKSIVSTAVGFAVDEGLVSLDTKVISLFPEYEHCEGDEWENLTLHSLLTMCSNKEFTFLQDMTGDYVEMFMKAPFRKEKGFLYSNNDAHMAAAIVQKLSGENLVDYLMPRLFEPLEIERPFWETNKKGECIGGTGAYLKARDLAKICQCYADSGRYEGKQIIPEKWVKAATQKYVDFEREDGFDGYGYLFWINGKAFSMTGMYGQIITCYPQHNAVVVSLNCTLNEPANELIIDKTLTKAFEGKNDEIWNERLEKYLIERGEKPVSSDTLPEIPVGKSFYLTPLSNALAKILFPASIITRSITSSFAKRPSSNMNNLSFALSEDVLTVKWFEEEDEVVINCALDGKPRLSECSIKGYPYKLWAYAYAENGKVNAVVKPLNTLSTQYITFDFSKKNVVGVQMKSTPRFTDFIVKNASHSSFIDNHPKLRPVTVGTLEAVLSTTERPMIFKAKK